jgi:PhzF family phenazine biosynthesis protein
MRTPLYQVDAFTGKPFKGNPAAVCLLQGPASEAWMQNIAAEMNLSETAFLYPNHEDGFNLRWFTPTVEVDLCGHATLASAHILWETNLLQPHKTAHFHTRSGLLSAVRYSEWIEMDFPAKAPEPTEPPEGLLSALGMTVHYIGSNRMDYLVEVESEEDVRALKPDFALLAQLPVRGIIVTGRASMPDYDFVSRFFAPAAGVPEDPVTGSAHCCLGPYWQSRLGKAELTAYQCSKRGGTVRVRVTPERVFLGGQAITVLKGELTVGDRE